ncbi:hypothetical protein PR003_g7124 [Phytophthora rubi]|uniref:SUEL-type lectin domain-containing protein n=1 Tax=Phytophthora rubi TaxID=129364 RepID=A0A6A4FEU6_9STRA|nr:hypothetical protein PR002_g7094 [Phytophthora rubi]KAE9347055.1 hypothetical protein PR003_g7124 [Phytophthora rubi]
MLRLAVISTVVLMLTEAQAQRTFTIRAHFTGASCDGSPSYAKVEEAPSCAAEDCSGLTGEGRARVVCSSELGYRADIHKLFGGAPYILRDIFGDYNCSELRFAEAFQASDKCEQRGGSRNFVRAYLDNNGTASVQHFRDDLCTPESLYATEDIEKETLENHLCDSNARKWYVSPGNSRALARILITSDGSGVNGNDTSTSATITGGATSSGTADGTSETSSTLGVDDTAVSTTSDTNIDTATSIEDSTPDTTSLNMDDTSTIRDDSTTVSSRSGSSTATSSSIGGGSSEASTALINDTTASATTETPIESSTSSSDTGSSSQGSASSTAKDSKSSRSSRVTITTSAPVLDTSNSTTDSSTTESVDNTVVADSSASGSRVSTPVATAKASVGTAAITLKRALLGTNVAH